MKAIKSIPFQVPSEVGSNRVAASARSLFTFLGVLVIAAMLAGCQQTQPVFNNAHPDAFAAAGVPVAVASNRLQEGDAIRIAFEGDTNLNAVAKIQLDGSVMLPLIGAVKAAGKTLEELQADLRSRYQPLLRVNEINLTMAGTAASVYVSGCVLRPGRIAMDRPLTALEAVMEAGGFDFARARPNAVTVLRLEDGRQKHYRIDLKAALQGDDPSPFQLKPFDIVHVPEKTFNF
jgi:polysaccharide biosynthesis/export protein